MTQSDSIFGAEPDRLRRLLTVGEEEVTNGSEKPTLQAASLEVLMERPGMCIGRYKLLDVLGEGGMGIVYLAEQEGSIRRRAALKVIKPGMDSKRVIARFENERQALALLDHANIAQVYDAGMTENGRPYFVMEYVRGLPITEYCDRNKLTINQRLRLFLEVCHGVHHAHQKGIIHRDIKPSNILVFVQEDKAIPKIIDFGVSKAINMPLTDKTLFTETRQLLGTPEYMSPEQADMANEDIDIRSDIYSLGVVLYELLTGVLPFDSTTFRESGIEYIRKVIRETDPRTPSMRLTKLGDEAKEVAERRRTEVYTLARCLHTELEWIPLKAMRKERSERYRSAAEFADDIENYLKGNPLIAGPPSTVYRVRKFMRRHKALITGAASVLVVLLAGILLSTIFAVEANRARDKEIVARAQAEQAQEQAQARELATRQLAYASDMSLAQHALSMNDLGRARRLLDDYRPGPGEVDLRGWEWRYLWQECQTDALSELFRYPNSAYSVEYSPNGEMLAVAGLIRRFIDIWDVNRRRRITTLQPEQGHLVAFSPRGDLLATDTGNEIRLWETSTWEQVDQRLTLPSNVSVLKFSPDGRYLASLSYPNVVTVWEVDRWSIVRQISGVRLVGTHIGTLDFSPDGRALAIGDANHHLQVVDITTGNAVFDIPQAHSEGITSVAWSPDGSVIASGSGYSGGAIRLWDAASGKPVGRLEGHTSWICELMFSTDGLWLYSASADQTIRIWDVEQQQCLTTLHGNTDEVYGLAISPDGTTLASASKDGAVTFWNARPRPKEEQPRVIPLDKRPALAPDSHVLAAPQEGIVRLFDLSTSKEVDKIPELGSDVSTVAYSPDGRLLVSGSINGRIRVWYCPERRLLREVGDSNAPIDFSAFRSDGMQFLSVDAKGEAIWWDTLTWQQVGTSMVKLESVSMGAAVSPDGRLLAVGRRSGTVDWLNAETGELRAATSTAHRHPVAGIAFSANGAQAASVAEDGTLAIWDPSSFQLIDVFKAHMRGAHGVAFSSDGRRLATGGSARDSVKLWDVSTHRELMTLTGQEGSSVFSFVAFSLDGRWLATCSREGKLHLWQAPSWEEIEAAEKHTENRQLP
jgi:WD40 repeat protein/serine/threonine protein kinase